MILEFVAKAISFRLIECVSLSVYARMNFVFKYKHTYE